MKTSDKATRNGTPGRPSEPPVGARTRRRRLGLAIGCAAWFLLAAPGAAQTTSPPTNPSPPKPPRTSPLDDELLRDLPPAAPRRTTPSDKPAPSGETTPPKPPVPPTEGSGVPKPKSDDEGEDIQIVGADEFLRDIRRRMKQVEQRLRNQDVSRSTQNEQAKIADELESFLGQLQRQSGAPRTSNAKDGGSGVGSDETGGKQQATQGKAAESSERSTEAERPGDLPGEANVETGESWGTLPPQLRQQIQNLTSERFLPQYERLIQQYYRRLAEPRRR